MRRATYTQGYARNRYQAAFPELWEGLVGYWDPGKGPTGLKLFGINGINGQLTNMVAADAWVVGERGYANDYDGGTAHINLGQPDVLDFVPGTDSFSITAWIKTSLGNEYIFSKADTDIATTRQYALLVASTGVLRAFIGGKEETGGDGSTDIRDNLWHQVVLLVTQDEFRFYLDGNLDNTPTNFTGTATSPEDVLIGARNSGAGTAFEFTGQMGPVSIYNIELPESRIRLMAAGATPAMLAEDVIFGIPSPAAIASAIYNAREIRTSYRARELETSYSAKELKTSYRARTDEERN